MKIQMLTQNDCPKCDNLKRFLDLGLGGKYTEDIEIVHKQNTPERYDEVKEPFTIMSTPVLICGDKILYDCNPMASEEFLRLNTGK